MISEGGGPRGGKPFRRPAQAQPAAAPSSPIKQGARSTAGQVRAIPVVRGSISQSSTKIMKGHGGTHERFAFEQMAAAFSPPARCTAAHAWSSTKGGGRLCASMTVKLKARLFQGGKFAKIWPASLHHGENLGALTDIAVYRAEFLNALSASRLPRHQLRTPTSSRHIPMSKGKSQTPKRQFQKASARPWARPLVFVIWTFADWDFTVSDRIPIPRLTDCPLFLSAPSFKNENGAAVLRPTLRLG